MKDSIETGKKQLFFFQETIILDNLNYDLLSQTGFNTKKEFCQ